MRISQVMANHIARKMTEVTQEKCNDLEKQFKQAVTDAFKKTIPDDVLKFAEKFPHFIQSCYSVRLNGNGWNHETVSIIGKLPSDNKGYDNFEPSKKDSDILKKLKHASDDAKKAYKTLLSDTENALLSLRTFARIKEHFPEAEKYLPPTMSNSLVVNFGNLQDRLKKQPITKVSEPAKVAV